MDSAAWNGRYATGELVWRAEPNRFLVEAVVGLTPGRALDVACGEGRNAVWLASRGWRVVGVDFSSVALAKGRRMAEDRGAEVEWVEADVVSWIPLRGVFDLVAVMYLHVPADQRRQVLANAAAALAPGGVLLVVGHDATNPAEGFGGPQDPAVLSTARRTSFATSAGCVSNEPNGCSDRSTPSPVPRWRSTRWSGPCDPPDGLRPVESE